MEVVEDRRLPIPVPAPVEPKPMVSRPPLPPTKEGRVAPIVPNIDSYERMLQEGKRLAPPQPNSSDREVRKPVVGKNMPPSPSTKMDAIRSQQPSTAANSSYVSQGSNRQLPSPRLGPGNRNNSMSAKKLEPVASEPGPRPGSIKRQSSADKITPARGSSSNRNIASPVRSEQQISKLPPKVPPKPVDAKPLPPSANSFKKPPAKSMVNPVRPQTGDSGRIARYSTNPGNNSNPAHRGDSREIVIKFDDFIKNFDESNNRLSKLRQQQNDGASSGRTPRYSSVKQKPRP